MKEARRYWGYRSQPDTPCLNSIPFGRFSYFLENRSVSLTRITETKGAIMADERPGHHQRARGLFDYLVTGGVIPFNPAD